MKKLKDEDKGVVYSPDEMKALDCLDLILCLGATIDERPYTYMQDLLELLQRNPSMVEFMLNRLKVINSERTIDTRTIEELAREVQES